MPESKKEGRISYYPILEKGQYNRYETIGWAAEKAIKGVLYHGEGRKKNHAKMDLHRVIAEAMSAQSQLAVA